MKKKFTALCALYLAALLATGCSNSSASESTSIETASNAVTNSADVTASESGAYETTSFSLKGLCGEDITVADFLEEHSEDSDFIELPFSVYTFEGFGYYSPTVGKAGVKSPCEPFNEEPFIDRPTLNYQHIDVGDKIGGLELKSANGMLFDRDGEISLEQQVLCFSGSLTLKGYIRLCVGDELYCEEDDLLFYPSD